MIFFFTSLPDIHEHNTNKVNFAQLSKVRIPSVATGMREMFSLWVDIRKVVKQAELFQMLTWRHDQATLTITML